MSNASQPSPALAPSDPAHWGMLAQVTLLVQSLRNSGHWAKLGMLAGGIILVIGANALGQVRLNSWQGAFYDALQQHDIGAFEQQLVVFLIIVSGLLFLVVAQTWLNEILKVRLRERLTRNLLDAWLKPKRVYLFAFTGDISLNPDQRLQEDIRHLTELTADLGVGLVQASLLLGTFVGVLWVLSAQVVFDFGGQTYSIPGYMVWCALAYATAGSWLTWRVGRPLIDLNEKRYAQEAEFRFSLVRVSEHGEAIALYRGEKGERASLDTVLDPLLLTMRRLAGGLARLTWVTSGYGWLTIVAPILAAAPGYFSGNLTLGALMMVVGAFNQVQSALRWFVDNFSRIADWRATLLRVVAIQHALDVLETKDAAEGRIEIRDHPENKLTLEKLQVYLPDSLYECAAFRLDTIDIAPGEHVLIVGQPSAGKTIFFLALAGLWQRGAGTILLPARTDLMFMPQRPYLPLGSLHAAVSYPAPVDRFGDEAVRAALTRVGLAHLTTMLDRENRWDKDLALDEQQALAFARLLLHAPKWVFIDDAASALDQDQRKLVMQIFGSDLAGSTVLSTARSKEDDGFYTRTLEIQRCLRF
ncbi:MAG: ABC transporter ATP-binding protein/permease [Hyphomicrobiales bacterium]